MNKTVFGNKGINLNFRIEDKISKKLKISMFKQILLLYNNKEYREFKKVINLFLDRSKNKLDKN
jgi:hypothetical protein